VGLRVATEVGSLDKTMNAFRYSKGELYCEGVPLARLAGEFGTPLYVYSQGHYGQYDGLHRACGRSIT
jgi:diaminopimelate decarboxylase